MRHPALAVGALALSAVAACSSASGTPSPGTTRLTSTSTSPSASPNASPHPPAGGSGAGASVSASAVAPSSAPSSAGPTGPRAAASPGGPPRGVPGDAPGSSQVAAAVKAFYDHYLADPAGEDITGYLTTAAAKRLLAPGGDADPVICAQNTPVSVSFAAPVVGDGEATVAVTTHWSGGTTAGPITVTVALPDILISEVSCPTS